MICRFVPIQGRAHFRLPNLRCCIFVAMEGGLLHGQIQARTNQVSGVRQALPARPYSLDKGGYVDSVSMVHMHIPELYVVPQRGYASHGPGDCSPGWVGAGALITAAMRSIHVALNACQQQHRDSPGFRR